MGTPVGKYAKDTSTPVERSRSEIETTLRRYGCTAFAFAWHRGGAMVQFEHKGRAIKLDVLPPPGLLAETEPYRREERRRWRVLLLWVKAQLEAIESRLVTFEDVFLPWTLLEDGSTVAQAAGAMKLLPARSTERPRLREANP